MRADFGNFGDICCLLMLVTLTSHFEGTRADRRGGREGWGGLRNQTLRKKPPSAPLKARLDMC
jgi:hypothetical protein